MCVKYDQKQKCQDISWKGFGTWPDAVSLWNSKQEVNELALEMLV